MNTTLALLAVVAPAFAGAAQEIVRADQAALFASSIARAAIASSMRGSTETGALPDDDPEQPAEEPRATHREEVAAPGLAGRVLTPFGAVLIAATMMACWRLRAPGLRP